MNKQEKQLSRVFDSKCRKRCPVCKVDKTYEGTICPSCYETGYRYSEAMGKILLVGGIDKYLKEPSDVLTKTIRASNELWKEVQAIAKKKKVSINALVVAALEKVVSEEK